MLNPFTWSFRKQYLAGFLVCVTLLAYAIYVQFQLEIEPCPLCIFQRIAFAFMGIFFLVGALHNPRAGGRQVYALLVLLGACAGIGIAGYHLWVQHLPPDPMAGCSPGFSYMINNLPISKVLKKVFSGEAECSTVNWTFLGLAMPFWTLVSYVLLGAGAVWAGFRKRGK
jgi:protein dithiol:quinone oxidoreductase